MDGYALDRVARAFASGGSRRRLLGLLTGLPLAGLLTEVAGEESTAKGHGRNRHHHPGKHKDQRKGKRKTGSAGDLFDECVRKLTSRGCTGVGRNGGGSCPPGTDLTKLNLNGCFLTGTVMNGVIFSTGQCEKTGRTSLQGANLVGAFLRGAKMQCVLAQHANMKGVHMEDAYAPSIDLTKAFLQGGHFQHAYMPASALTGEAQSANFTEAVLTCSNFVDGKFEGAIFQDAELNKTDWQGYFGVTARCPDGTDARFDCCSHLNGYTTITCSGRTGKDCS